MKSAKGKITTTKTVGLDQEALSLAIRAELAVVEAEKEKEAERIKNLPNYYWNMRMPGGVYSNIQITKEPPFICKNWYSGVMYKQLKQKLTKYIIRSILLSLLVGYTASFIIK